MTPKALLKAIHAEQKKLAKVRDKLRDLEDEAAQLKDDAAEAHQYLQIAADKLSEMQ